MPLVSLPTAANAPRRLRRVASPPEHKNVGGSEGDDGAKPAATKLKGSTAKLRAAAKKVLFLICFAIDMGNIQQVSAINAMKGAAIKRSSTGAPSQGHVQLKRTTTADLPRLPTIERLPRK